MNWGYLILSLQGLFWLVSGVIFFVQMTRGNFSPAKKVHQDLDSNASNSIWFVKIMFTILAGGGWLGLGIYGEVNQSYNVQWLILALCIFPAFQITSLAFNPKYSKARTGIIPSVVIPVAIYLLALI